MAEYTQMEIAKAEKNAVTQLELMRLFARVSTIAINPDNLPDTMSIFTPGRIYTIKAGATEVEIKEWGALNG